MRLLLSGFGGNVGNPEPSPYFQHCHQLQLLLLLLLRGRSRPMSPSCGGCPLLCQRLSWLLRAHIDWLLPAPSQASTCTPQPSNRVLIARCPYSSCNKRTNSSTPSLTTTSISSRSRSRSRSSRVLGGRASRGGRRLWAAGARRGSCDPPYAAGYTRRRSHLRLPRHHTRTPLTSTCIHIHSYRALYHLHLLTY